MAQAKSIVVATDGNGVAAPSVCGMLGQEGVVSHLRREGASLHVVDYAGALDNEGLGPACPFQGGNRASLSRLSRERLFLVISLSSLREVSTLS